MKLNKYFAILLLLAIASCTSRKETNEIVIDLTNLTQDTLYYSSFVDSLSYIDLETKDECLIGEITDLIIADPYLFILDNRQQTVWVFYVDGTFSHVISRKGSGPEEYARLAQFEYDASMNELLLLDGWSKTILRYSVDGEFVDKVKLNLYPSDFKKTSEGYLLSLLGAPDSVGGVYNYNLKTDQYTKLIKRSDNISCNFNWEMITYDGTIALMASPFDNVVYHYDDGQMKECLPLRIIPFSGAKYEYTSSKQNLPDFLRTGYVEGSHWLYVTYWNAPQSLRVLLFDKQRKKYEVARELVNDIDGIKSSYTTSACDQNRFVFGCSKEDGTNPHLQILHLKK